MSLDKTLSERSSVATYFLPTLQPGETIYGWCSTVSRMAHFSGEKSSARVLLGAAHAGRQHDIPAHLGHLLEQFSACLPSGADCLRHHTIAGYYLPFVSPIRRERLVESLLEGNSMFARRGVLQWSRTLSASTRLRYCLQCVDADVQKIGRPLWRTVHQFPTTTSCDLHNVPLIEVIQHRKGWSLPGEERGEALNFGATDAAFTLSMIGSVLPLIDFAEGTSIRAEAVLRLRDLGVVVSDRGVSHSLLANWFRSSGTGRLCAAATNNPLSVLADGSWIPTLLWRKQSMSAIRWAVFWSALGWSSGLSAATSLMAAALGARTDIQGQHLMFGLAPSSRTAPAAVWAAFERADSYEAAMKILGVSRGRLVRWLEDDPELRKCWRGRLRDKYLNPTLAKLADAKKAEVFISRDMFVRKNAYDLKWLKQHFPAVHEEIVRGLPARGQAQAVLFPF